MKIKNFPQKLYQFSLLLLVLASSYFFIRTLSNQYEIITSPYQQDYRETVHVLAVELMIKGENPYRIEYQPEYAQAYGIVQDLIYYPFAKIFGSSIQLHRWLTALGGLLSSFVVLLWLLTLRTNIIIAVSASMILYLNLLFWQLGISRPDSWALFFMLLSMYIPFKFNYSIKSLFISILFGLIAFYTKSYFVLGSVFISSFMFFFLSKKKGIVYGFSFLLLFVGSIYIVSYFFPLFFYLTVLSFLNYATDTDWNHANFQLFQFFRIHSAIFILFLIGVFYYFYYKNKHKLQYSFDWNLSSFNQPLFTIQNISLSLIFRIYTFFIIFFIIHYFLGGNIGAYLSYYFTHVTPFLLLLVIPMITFILEKNKLVASIAVILVLFGVWNARKALFSHKLNEEQIEQWEKAKVYIQNNSNILGTPATANLIRERGIKVYEQGLLGQFMVIGDVKKPFLQKLFPRYKEIQKVSKEFDTSITKKIQNKEFDLIVMPDIHATIASDKNVELYYNKIDSARLEMPFTGQSWKITFWKPKKN